MLHGVPELPHTADLVSSAVSGTRVTHAVPVVSVCVSFHDDWPIVQDVLLGILHSLDITTAFEFGLRCSMGLD